MIASSVTGVSGPGESGGMYKPKNNCSCSCCYEQNKSEEINKIKKGCYIKYNSSSHNKYKIYSASSAIRTC